MPYSEKQTISGKDLFWDANDRLLKIERQMTRTILLYIFTGTHHTVSQARASALGFAIVWVGEVFGFVHITSPR